MGWRNPMVWVILIALVVLLFGASRLPDLTRNIGKSLKIFKEEVRDLQDDKSQATIEQPPTQPGPQSAEATTPQPPQEAIPPQPPTPPADNGN